MTVICLQKLKWADVFYLKNNYAREEKALERVNSIGYRYSMFDRAGSGNNQNRGINGYSKNRHSTILA
jgi:hypothetical protein